MSLQVRVQAAYMAEGGGTAYIHLNFSAGKQLHKQNLTCTGVYWNISTRLIFQERKKMYKNNNNKHFNYQFSLRAKTKTKREEARSTKMFKKRTTLTLAALITVAA